MLTHNAAAGAPRAPEPPLQRSEPAAALLEEAGEVAGDHVLVLGNDGPELMCALLRAGALEVTHLNSHERLDGDSATMVIVPWIASVEWLAAALPSITRALLPTGRIVLRTGDDADAATVGRIRRMLVRHGYSRIHLRRGENCALASAELPALDLQELELKKVA